MQHSQLDAIICARVERWVEAVVIGLNLCPFASAALRRDQLGLVVAQSSSSAECLQQMVDEADALLAGDPQATCLLVLPEGYADFDDYLDLLATADALLEDIGLEGQIQLASFHPHYQFEDTDYDDPGNWTNRAPYPMLHLLTEESVASAVDAHPDPDGIPEANIARLEGLGVEVLEALNRAADG